MKNKFFNASATGTTLTMALYDVIGGDMFGNGITPQMVSDALSQSGCTDITLRLNSPGGDAFAGVAIYNILRASKLPVNVIVDGMAASAASIIAMAGDSITMNQGSVMMIHEAQGMAYGDAATMVKMADTLKTVTGSIADIYASRTKTSKKDVLDMMAEETWMDSKDCVAKNFATAVSKEASIGNSFDLSAFRNVPETLKAVAKTKEVDGDHLTAGDFVYVGNSDDTSTWSLPWHFSTDEKTKSHLRDALARFDQDEVIPESHKAEAHAKLLRLCQEHGIDVTKDGKKAKNEADPVVVETAVDTLSLKLKQIEINRRK
jgi:ATP-dependent protease ClpP protease subunit